MIRRATGAPVLVVFACLLAAAAEAGAQALPAPDPISGQQHIFYGETPRGALDAPVIVFVHGINAQASSWWLPPNDMYARAFRAGYRTAFVGLNTDNTPDLDGILANVPVLQAALPEVLAHFGAPQMYIVAHSKGGLDVQAALTSLPLAAHVRAVFTIATPHQGTELADWAFGPGQASATPLGLINAAIASLTRAAIAQFRQSVELSSIVAGVPYYTISGASWATPAHPLLLATGPLLAALTGGQPNDGLITLARSKLPRTSPYGFDLGELPVNHSGAALGSVAFPRINAQIRMLEGSRYAKIADHGLATDGRGTPLPGTEDNSFPWSMQWFKGKLYVGTTRDSVCVTTATADAATGTNTYAEYSATPEFGCTPDPRDLPLRAEIWRYTPETLVWERVYQSPADVPIAFGPDGRPTKFTARDIGFRGMIVFRENAGKSAQSNGKGKAKALGRERLYVGGVSAASLFEKEPPYVGDGALRFPPPRMLWTEDGVTWNEVPQEPGTFFGDITAHDRPTRDRGFRSFATVTDAHGINHLFVTVTNLKGIGRVLASTDPSEGNDAWRQVSPYTEELPIFTIHSYRNALYATGTLGGVDAPSGYGIFRAEPDVADPSMPGRLLFTPVVLPTEGLAFPPNAAVSMQEFRGQLYVGSDRPTEIIRINPDHSWDLIVGTPRFTSRGFKLPLSTIGMGFNSIVNGHFYSMAVHDDELYVGTWDWSENVRDTVFNPFMKHGNGFDLFKTADGINWSVVSRNGLGDRSSAIIRNMVSTPFGLFIGAANLHTGLQIHLDQRVLDFTGDGAIDQGDVDVLLAAANARADGPDDRRDLDRDGRITRQDAKALAAQCERPGCAAPPVLPVRGPEWLAGQQTAPARMKLSWPESPGAVRYHVFRSDPMTVDGLVPATTQLQLFNGMTATVQEIQNGAWDEVCQLDPAEVTLCAVAAGLRTSALMMYAWRWIGSTTSGTYLDLAVPDTGQVFYSVVAEDPEGVMSEPTNIVAGPSSGTLP